ncbi:MAG: suppressor of fused domain protein [Myxococcaceae bacterium]
MAARKSARKKTTGATSSRPSASKSKPVKAAPRTASSRTAEAPARKRGSSVPAAPAAPPPPPPVDPVRRREAMATALEAVRARLWGEQGQPLTTVAGVTIAFAALEKPKAHWHLMTFGLATRGFELSLRVLRAKEELAPPAWPVTLLTTLIERATSGVLHGDTNQVLLLEQGLAPGLTTDLTGLIFAVDPGAGTLKTAFDEAPVLLVVPVTADEVRTVREWSPSGLVDVLSKVDPLLLTDLERASLLQSPRARVLIEQRIEREGSSLSTLTSERGEVKKTGKGLSWSMPVATAETLISLVKGRTGHQRPFAVVAPGLEVKVINADAPSVSLEGRTLTLKLSLVAARQLRAQLRAKEGTWRFDFLPDFELVITP